MSDRIDLVFHHGGNFARDSTGKLEYISGEIDTWEGVSMDQIDVSGLSELFKEHGYYDYKSVSWLVPGLEFEKGLRTIMTDIDVVEMCNAAKGNNHEISLYFEHHVRGLEDVIEVEEEESNGTEAEIPMFVEEEPIANHDANNEDHQNNQQNQSDDEVEGEQHKEDDCKTEDEFTDDCESADESPCRPPPKLDDSLLENSFSTDDEYHSEELRSLSSDSEDEEEEDDTSEPIYPKFNEHAQFGHVVLELEMLFPTLELFKRAVKDYNIHLERDVKWIKNDKTRCRAKCRDANCRWEIYCSESSTTKCFQIKTFYREHTCDESSTSKLADSSWVIPKLETKLRTQPDLTNAQALDYMKTEFGVDIDISKVSRSLKKARELLEGPIRRPIGRPRKRQRNDGNELPVNSHKVSCSKCGATGHNCRTCKEFPAPKKRKQKQKETTKAGDGSNEARSSGEITEFFIEPLEVQPLQSYPAISPLNSEN